MARSALRRPAPLVPVGSLVTGARVVESNIRWRGSVTDLATDCAYLLTRDEVLELARTLQSFADMPALARLKILGKGREP